MCGGRSGAESGEADGEARATRNTLPDRRPHRTAPTEGSWLLVWRVDCRWSARTFDSHPQNGLSGGVGGHPLLKSPKALARAPAHTRRSDTREERTADTREERPQSDEGALAGEDATTAANTTKGVAEGSDWRARNEPPEPTIEA